MLKWKLDRLLDTYAYDLPKAEGTIVKLDSTVQGLKIALTASERLTKIRTIERDLKVAEVNKCDSIANNSEVIFKEGIKAEKRKGWKKGAVGLILGFVGAALLLQ